VNAPRNPDFVLKCTANFGKTAVEHHLTCQDCLHWSPSEMDGTADEYTHHLAPDDDLDSHHGVCTFVDGGRDEAWITGGGHLITDGRFFSCPFFVQKP
jgi:hypothetical protein